jgi:hypothetical protein
MLEKRQCARLMADFLHKQIDETRFQLVPNQLGRPFNCPPQFVFRHWPDEAMVIRQRRRQVGISRAPGIKAGAHGQNHQRLSLDGFCRIKKVADERLAEFFFTTKRKQFFELVYKDYQPYAAGIFG